MLRANKPVFGVIEITHKCNMRCRMCNYWKFSDKEEMLSLNDWKQFIVQLKDFVEEGMEINISGGEPFIKEWILDLVEFISGQNLVVSLTTNASFINNEVAKRITESGLSVLPLSLDSLKEETHDFLRGKKGVYSRVMEVLDYLSGNRGTLKSLNIQTVISAVNLDDVVEIAKWAEKHKIQVYFLALMRPVGLPLEEKDWYLKENYSFLWPKDVRKVEKVIDELINLKQEGHRIDNSEAQLRAFKNYFTRPDLFVKEKPCGLDDGTININPFGDIHLCWEIEPSPIGHIGDDLNKIWYKYETEELRKKIRDCKKNCAQMVNCYFEE